MEKWNNEKYIGLNDLETITMSALLLYQNFDFLDSKSLRSMLQGALNSTKEKMMKIFEDLL
jgi:hypothetical protein